MDEEIGYRKFFIGFTFIVTSDGYGTERHYGNMGMKFKNMNKNVDMFIAARKFIAKTFELESHEQVTIILFEELEE